MLNDASKRNLDGVHSDLRAVVLRAAELTEQPFIVSDGLRTTDEQRELLAKGRTTTLNSWHLTGHAVDLAALVDGKPEFNDRKPYRPIWNAVKLAAAELGVPVEWGGNWTSFVDVFHFQLPGRDYPRGQEVTKLDPARQFDPAKFEKVVSLILETEGGWNAADPSNRGITLDTLRRWKGEDAGIDTLKALSEAEAKTIYRALYWHAVRGDDLPPGLDYAVMDFAVHSGPPVAASFLQKLVGTEQDGIIGPVTLAAVRSKDPAELIDQLMAARFERMKGLSNWQRNKDGWTRRIDDVRRTALAMVEMEPEPDRPKPPEPVPLRAEELIEQLRTIYGAAEIRVTALYRNP